MSEGFSRLRNGTIFPRSRRLIGWLRNALRRSGRSSCRIWGIMGRAFLGVCGDTDRLACRSLSACRSGESRNPALALTLVIPAKAGIQFLAFDLLVVESQSFHSPA